MQQLSFFSTPRKPTPPPLVGYILTADNCLDQSKAFDTYMMARTLSDAFDWCILHFPLEEGYVHLEIWNHETDFRRRLMPNEYVGKDGTLQTATNTLSEQRIGELEFHIPDCDVCLQDCPDCWEYYSNMGHDQYVLVLTSKM